MIRNRGIVSYSISLFAEHVPLTRSRNREAHEGRQSRNPRILSGIAHPNGYDLRIAELLLPELGIVVKEGMAKVPPKAMFYVSTMEYVELPDDVAAQLWTRTSWIRKGLIVGLGKIDAGFHGTLTFMGFNLSSKEVEIPIGAASSRCASRPCTPRWK